MVCPASLLPHRRTFGPCWRFTDFLPAYPVHRRNVGADCKHTVCPASLPCSQMFVLVDLKHTVYPASLPCSRTDGPEAQRYVLPAYCVHKCTYWWAWSTRYVLPAYPVHRLLSDLAESTRYVLPAYPFHRCMYWWTWSTRYALPAYPVHRHTVEPSSRRMVCHASLPHSQMYVLMDLKHTVCPVSLPCSQTYCRTGLEAHGMSCQLTPFTDLRADGPEAHSMSCQLTLFTDVLSDLVEGTWYVMPAAGGVQAVEGDETAVFHPGSVWLMDQQAIPAVYSPVSVGERGAICPPPHAFLTTVRQTWTEEWTQDTTLFLEVWIHITVCHLYECPHIFDRHHLLCNKQEAQGPWRSARSLAS